MILFSLTLNNSLEKDVLVFTRGGWVAGWLSGLSFPFHTPRMTKKKPDRFFIKKLPPFQSDLHCPYSIETPSIFQPPTL